MLSPDASAKYSKWIDDIDPDVVDIMLSRELTGLSVKERIDIQEEIHGVRTPPPEETLDLIETGLAEMERALTEMDPSQKQMYLHMQEQRTQNALYIDAADFRLQFLRCEQWNAKKAAKRFAAFLQVAVDNFGYYALERPILISDFTDKEMKQLRKGEIQLLPFRDRSGRRIVAMVSNIGLGMDPTAKVKFCLYMAQVMNQDLESQQKGFVLVMFSGDHAGFKLPNEGDDRAAKQLQESFPIRYSALHGCFPDTPVFRIMQAIQTLASSKDHRLRLRFHVGRSLENRYRLLSYGIPVDTIPITDTGTVKTKHFIQWIKSRQMIEAAAKQSDTTAYIDSPLSTDVVFRNGTSTMSHPGNVKFRDLIATHFPEHSQATSAQQKSAVSWKVVDQVLKNGRFLQWDKRMACWTPMTNKKEIRTKVALNLRDFKKLIGAANNLQTFSSSTHKFEDQDGRQKRRRTGGVDSDGGCADLFCAFGSHVI